MSMLGAKSRALVKEAPNELIPRQMCSQEGDMERSSHRRDHPRSQSLRLLRQRNGAIRLDDIQTQARRIRQASEWHIRKEPRQRQGRMALRPRTPTLQKRSRSGPPRRRQRDHPCKEDPTRHRRPPKHTQEHPRQRTRHHLRRLLRP